MKKEDFIDQLYSAGWTSPNDAQHTKIGELFIELFPKDAQIEELEKNIYNLEYKNNH